MKHLAWLVAIAACTDFSPVQRDVCGNGLLEAGEDCDSSDASCVSCSVACATVAECPTSDYACGVDGLCHAPGGVLGLPQTAGTFEAGEVRISDLDGDGLGDALGLTRTSVVVAHGDATAQLDQITSIVTPTQTGPAAFGDLDRDGTLDLTLTTPDGLVSYASPYGELAPVPINTSFHDEGTGKALDIRRLFYLAPNVISGLIVDPDTGNGYVIVVDGSGETTQLGVTGPCFARQGITSGAVLENAKFDIYNVSKRSDKNVDAVLGITTQGANHKLCVISIHRDAPNVFTPSVTPVFTFTDITPNPAATPSALPVLADIDTDSDPCPGLVLQDNGLQALVYWEGEMQSSKCVLLPPNASPQNPKTLQPMDAGPNSVLVGRAPVDPPYFLVASDALVTNEGVYPTLLGAYFFNVYRTSRTITQFAIGDFDGDGGKDVAFQSAGEEDLDVLFRVHEQPGFNLYRVDTRTSVTTLTSGDFDGNGIDDLAYTESLDDHDRLMISFGTPDRPLEPRSAGSFAKILSVGRVSIRDSVDYLGVAEDLIVFQPPEAGATEKRITLLHGSPQRTMLSYFDPRLENLRAETLFRGSVIGNFASDTGAQYTDLIAIAPAASVGSASSSVVRAWRVPGTPSGLDVTSTSGLTMQGLSDCSLASSSSLCLDVASYVAFPVSADHDVVIAVDKSRRAIMVDPWTSGSGMVSSQSLDVLAAVIPEQTIPRSMYASDLDGDGNAELVVAFAPAPSSGVNGAIIVCSMQDGIAQSCEDLAPAVMSAAAEAGYPVESCYDATVGKLSHHDATTEPDPTADVVVACRGDGTTLLRVHRGTAGTGIVRLVTVPVPVTRIRAGDVTGDHVDDIVLLEGTNVSSLVVYPQCSSRDLTCIGGGK